MTGLVTLPENIIGRDLIVSDIHGHFPQLERLLAEQHFNPDADRLIAVGDMIDRGPQSARALEFLAQPWFFSVLGNHEQAMLDWLDALLDDAPAETVREFAGRHAAWGGDWAIPLLTAAMRGPRDEVRRWQRALRALPLAIVIPRAGKRIGVVHATVPGGDWAALAANCQGAGSSPPREAVLWERLPLADANEPRVTGIDLVFAGHNVVDTPRRIGNFWMIETGAWKGGDITLVDIDRWPPPVAPQPAWRRWIRPS